MSVFMVRKRGGGGGGVKNCVQAYQVPGFGRLCVFLLGAQKPQHEKGPPSLT